MPDCCFESSNLVSLAQAFGSENADLIRSGSSQDLRLLDRRMEAVNQRKSSKNLLFLILLINFQKSGDLHLLICGLQMRTPLASLRRTRQ